MSKYFCVKCGLPIIKKHQLICEECKLAEYKKAKEKRIKQNRKTIGEEDTEIEIKERQAQSSEPL